jgi:hypothetical protein
MKPSEYGQTGQRSVLTVIGLVVLAAATGFLLARGYDPVHSQPIAPAERTQPAPFRFETFDGPTFDEIEAAANAQAELLRRFPVGSDVTALARLFEVQEPDRKAWCETRSAGDGKAALFCIFAHRPNPSLGQYIVNWSVRANFDEASRKITDISVRKRYF